MKQITCGNFILRTQKTQAPNWCVSLTGFAQPLCCSASTHNFGKHSRKEIATAFMVAFFFGAQFLLLKSY
jgi:hypothetical protein